MKESLFHKKPQSRRTFLKKMESTYEVLRDNDSDIYREAREILDCWYGYFKGNESEFLGRFRNSDLNHHYSALFELFVYAFFTSLNFDVRFDIPDLHLRNNANEEFWIECKSAYQSIYDTVHEVYLYRINKKLNDFKYPGFEFGVHVERFSHHDPHVGRINRKLENEIKKLDYDVFVNTVESKKKGIDILFKNNGWKVRISVLPAIHKETGEKMNSYVSYCMNPFVEFIENRLLIKSLIKKRKKMKEYTSKVGGSPLFIAINTNDLEFNISGFESYVFNKESSFFYSNGESKNPNVSGLFIVHKINYLNLFPKIYFLVNPIYANNPSEIGSIFDQLRIEKPSQMIDKSIEINSKEFLIDLCR